MGESSDIPVGDTDGAWHWNLATDEVLYSPRWFQMLGYPDKHGPPSMDTFTRLVHPDDLQGIFERLARTVEASDDLPYSTEFRMLGADGGWRRILGRCRVIERDSSGRALRLSCSHTELDGSGPSPAQGEAADSCSDIASLKGLKVLVAEDNDINLEILTELLRRAGVEVRAARDGGEAVKACAEGWPELVLMDMQMPDIDGLTATRLLRRDARFAALPIIALTANAMSEDRARCLDAGMNDHLPKPVEVDDLYAMLHRWRPK